MVQAFPAAETTTSKRAAVPSASNRKLRIAVADDMSAMRTVLAGLLRDEGHDVREACDGVELLAVVARFAPDVIVTDFQMPKMSGLDALRVLRERACSASVVLMTASPLAEVRAAAFALGASAVLPKPFELRDLLSLIQT